MVEIEVAATDFSLEMRVLLMRSDSRILAPPSLKPT